MEVNLWRCNLCKKVMSSASRPTNCNVCGEGRVRLKKFIKRRGRGKNMKYAWIRTKKYLIKPHFEKVAGKSWAYQLK